MTKAEADVPLRERHLLVEGRASTEARAALRGALPESWDERHELLFLSFAYAGLSIGRQFECCFSATDYRDCELVTTTVVAVTQQFAKPFDSIPDGWATVTLLRFDPAVPDLVRRLPVSSRFLEHQVSVYIADEAAWEAKRSVSLLPPDIVALIEENRSRGVSMHQIIEKLNHEGVANPHEGENLDADAAGNGAQFTTRSPA